MKKVLVPIADIEAIQKTLLAALLHIKLAGDDYLVERCADARSCLAAAMNPELARTA
jgi:hypothetical protein